LPGTAVPSPWFLNYKRMLHRRLTLMNRDLPQRISDASLMTSLPARRST
jgi:hypothetical protein